MASAITKIAELNGDGSSAVISFTSIPSRYKDLMFLCSLRNTGSGTSYINNEVKINSNGDTGTNYWTAESYLRYNLIKFQIYSNSDRIRAIMAATTSGSTNAWGTFRFFCPGYGDPSIYKRFDGLSAVHQTGQQQNSIQGNYGWDQYAAINRIDFTSNASMSAFETNSRISLYGIK